MQKTKAKRKKDFCSSSPENKRAEQINSTAAQVSIDYHPNTVKISSFPRPDFWSKMVSVDLQDDMKCYCSEML